MRFYSNSSLMRRSRKFTAEMRFHRLIKCLVMSSKLLRSLLISPSSRCGKKRYKKEEEDDEEKSDYEKKGKKI